MKKILATGRLVDRDKTTKLTSVHIDKNVLTWVEENCSGNKQLVFNYLMQKGIEALISEESPVILEDLNEHNFL
jgi:hypothetical protein